MSESDHILAERCQKGDRRAQKELYQQYRRMLFGVCLRYAANRQEAEDLLQESLLRIYTDLYQYQPTGPLGAWLRRVTVNVALQQLRKKKRLFPTEDLDQLADRGEEEEDWFAEDRARALLAMVQQLPEGYRLVFNLHVIEGLSHAEIAQHLDISVNTSKSQLSRSKALLRKMLEKKVST
ncbi:MAG: RNA polymerase sigma factor [Bacteroidota bacterium]